MWTAGILSADDDVDRASAWNVSQQTGDLALLHARQVYTIHLHRANHLSVAYTWQIIYRSV